MTDTTSRTDEIAALTADFEAFSKVMDSALAGEIESFQGLSRQFGLRDETDGLLDRIRRVRDVIRAGIGQLGDGNQAAGAFSKQALTLVSRVALLDSLFDQLARYAVVAELRGAADTAGNLLTMVQNWAKMLREWLAGLSRQMVLLAALGTDASGWQLRGEPGRGLAGAALIRDFGAD